MASLTSHVFRSIQPNFNTFRKFSPLVTKNSENFNVLFCQSRHIAISSVVNDKSRDIKTPSKLKTVAVKKYVGFLGKFEQTLEKKFPKAHKIFSLFKEGIKSFFNDTRVYYRVTTDLWKGRDPKTLTWRELENYRTFPKELLKVGPTVILLNLPITDVIVPFIVYFFPRQLLCRHFWTKDQRDKYGLYYFRQRIKHYPNILHYLEQHSKDIKKDDLKITFNNLLSKIEKGDNGTVDDLFNVERLFARKPFGLGYLSTIHRIHYWHIAKSWSMSTWRKSKLIQDIQLVHFIDLALDRENLNELTDEELKTLCFSRGLNPLKLERNFLINYLKEWIRLSKKIDEKNVSLLLHAPVLLTYRVKSNEDLIKDSELINDD